MSATAAAPDGSSSSSSNDAAPLRRVVDGLQADAPVKRDRHPPWYPPSQCSGMTASRRDGHGNTTSPTSPPLPTTTTATTTATTATTATATSSDDTDGNNSGGYVGLRVMNSLTETLEPFAPREGRVVRWYTCGPTVYDVAHMGHARAYLTFDILRRIMEDYFHYNVLYQMNITDIDDKIIKRARVNKLLADYKHKLQQLQQQQQQKSATTTAAAAAGAHDKNEGDEAQRGEADGDAAWQQLCAFTDDALRAATTSLSARRSKLAQPLPADANSRAKAERDEKLLELELRESQLSETRERVAAARATRQLPTLFDAASAVNGELLDALDGDKVTDADIFDAHARTYERAFFDDMQRLGVRPPDVVTRVTEYVPQVVAFITRIMQHGFAYVAQSSVFFDTEAFVKAGHDYPKLKPGGERNASEEEMAEGEGALSRAAASEKRSANDFALWKFSKPGEPRWPSPWGAGRPGWHIECSVMASDVLGSNMDIHSGGWDLKFPHHDNECAQSEACNLQHQWVNYFLHCGHLHIKGLKMSKSLKNFITIRQALDELGVNARTMRLLFLANAWHKPMNFSDQSLDEARERERVLRAFFGSVEVALRGGNAAAWQQPQGLQPHDRELLERWRACELAVHAALLNNFDTPTALQQLLGLVAATNQYLMCGERISATLLRKVARYLTDMFRTFGVIEGNDAIGLSATAGGVGGAARNKKGGSANNTQRQRRTARAAARAAATTAEGEAASSHASGSDKNDAVYDDNDDDDGDDSGDAAEADGDNFVRVVDALVAFRDGVREAARQSGAAASQALLPLCDRVRDEWLVDAGVRLEDKPGGATVWKSDDPAILRQELQARKQQQANERLQKLRNVIDKQRKLVDKWQRYSCPPAAYLAQQEEARPAGERKYRHFDPVSGLPHELISGELVSDKDLKKLEKEVAKYSKTYDEYIEKGGSEWLQQQKDALAASEEELRTLEAEANNATNASESNTQ